MARAWPDLRRTMAVAAVAVALVAGSAFVWIGVPVMGLWLAGEVTTTTQGFLFATLGGIPPAMVGFGWLLYRLNGVYERLRGGPDQSASPRAAWLVSLSDERGRSRRARAPRPLIDIAMTTSAVAALVLMAIWFFFLAESPLAPLP
jgi:hypothetical protein